MTIDAMTLPGIAVESVDAQRTVVTTRVVTTEARAVVGVTVTKRCVAVTMTTTLHASCNTCSGKPMIMSDVSAADKQMTQP